jgi:hypothetical protein
MTFNRTTLLSALIVTARMSMVLILLDPVHSSYEEIGIQYRLSGADGMPASYLTHLDHGWHFWLSYLVFKAFLAVPTINWYSILLVCCQWIAGWIIGCAILKKMDATRGISVFLLFELFVSTPFLLDLNITGTSILLTMAGLSTGWNGDLERLTRLRIGIAVAFLVLAGMLRMHTLALVLVAATPYMLLTRGIRTNFRLGVGLFVCVLITLGLNKLHVTHYQKNIPDWSKQEKFRQAFFEVVNKPINTKLVDSGARKSFLFTRSGILWDSQFVSTDKMNLLVQHAYQPRSASIQQNAAIFYWVFQNNQFLILLFLAASVYACHFNRKKAFFILVCSAFLLLLLIGMWNWHKLSNHIIVAVTGVQLLGCLVYLNPRIERDSISKLGKLIIIVAYSILILAGIRIAYRTNFRYQRFTERWRTIQEQIAEHKDSFFILTGNQMFNQAFSIWRSPAVMPMNNTLSAIRTIFGQDHQKCRYYEALQKEGANSQLGNLLFAGEEIDLIGSAYPHVKFSEPLPEYKGMTVRKIEYRIRTTQP